MKPAWRWCVRSALPGPGCWRMRCTARCRCTKPMAAWCRNLPAANISPARPPPPPPGPAAGRRRAGVADVVVRAYPRGPGGAGAVLVGAGLACALAAALGKPVLGVHHLEGHLLSPFLSADPPEF